MGLSFEMSANAWFLKSGFITANAPLRNGVGRYIPQLARITIKFCKNNGNSKGVREFIQQDVVQFATQNPGTVVYLKPRRHRTPVLVAEYLSGERHWQSLHNYNCAEVGAWIDYYRTHSGREFMDQYKMTYSDHPSIQGMWHQYTHSDPSLATAQFPSPLLSEAGNVATSASDRLVELFNSQEGNISSLTREEEDKLENRKQGEAGD